MATYRVIKDTAPAVLKDKPAKQAACDQPVTVASYTSTDYPSTKTAGTQIRGCGAATKGKMARGPMG